MGKKNFDIYINLGLSTLTTNIFSKIDNSSVFIEETKCELDQNEKHTDLLIVNKIVKKNIFNIEKITGEFLNDVNLLVETTDSISINLSLSKNNEGEKIVKKDIQYLIQDAKQQILRSYLKKDILHIIVENYIFDGVKYNYLPLNINCKKLSINIRFICLPKILIKELQKIFNDNDIIINRIMCSTYVKSFTNPESKLDICKIALNLSEGMNDQEVVLIPKALEKVGFFEKLFHFFK